MDTAEKILELREIELKLEELEREKEKLVRRRKALLEIGSKYRLEKPSALSREEWQVRLRHAAFGGRQ